MTEKHEKPVLICDSQPLAVEGIRTLLDQSGDLRFAGAVYSLDAAMELARTMSPAAVIVDKGHGASAVMNWLHRLSQSRSMTAPVVWGTPINEGEALRFLQAGARGVMRRTVETDGMMNCLRTVVTGNTWMEEGIFSNAGCISPARRSDLTPREAQVVQLVEQGLKNRDIARTLGIQTGTVKIHLKHIFEKTGVRGRYGLALTGLRERGAISLSPM